MSKCGGREGEVHDLRSHFHTSIFQGSHWLTRSSALIPNRSLMNVCCSWWQGPLMSSNFLCSFPALLEGLGIIPLLLPARLDPGNPDQVVSGQICFVTGRVFSYGPLLPSCPGAGFLTEIITWEIQGLACCQDLQTPLLSSLSLHPPLLPHRARETFSNLKQKFCGLL